MAKTTEQRSLPRDLAIGVGVTLVEATEDKVILGTWHLEKWEIHCIGQVQRRNPRNRLGAQSHALSEAWQQCEAEAPRLCAHRRREHYRPGEKGIEALRPNDGAGRVGSKRVAARPPLRGLSLRVAVRREAACLWLRSSAWPTERHVGVTPKRGVFLARVDESATMAGAGGWRKDKEIREAPGRLEQ